MNETTPNTLESLLSGPPSLAIDGPVATITLHRPETHNRIEPDDVGQIRRYLKKLNDTPEVLVIIFASTGPSFSSGFDLTRFATSTQAALNASDNAFEALCDELENARAVTIAKLHAPVYGGATDLALSCDFRMGAQGIRMFMPAARLGLHYYGHGIRRWVSRLGLGPAKKLFLTSRTIHAEEMLRIGYLDLLAARDKLDAEVDAWVQDILSMAPLCVVSMKATLNQTARYEYDESSAVAAFERSLATRDMAEALAAFAEHRKPVFKGE
jgi:enoyl-CoA hydratase/carnithine racemase